MSQIFTQWRCEHCGHEFSQYISFGHPDKGFNYRWKCADCEETNILHIDAFPECPEFIQTKAALVKEVVILIV